MAITKKDVEYVANLARLNLSEKEKEMFAVQLKSILKYIDKLKELNTDNVVPTSHVLDVKNAFRKDEVKECDKDIKEALLKIAPEREDNFYKVKKVI